VARVSYVEPNSASREVQQIYEHRLRGKPANVHKAMAHNPQALVPFLAFYQAVGKSLDRRLWELVYLRISFLNGCEYCAQHHVTSSKKVGLGPEDWQVLQNGELERFSDAEQAALKYAEKLTRTPEAIGDADIGSLKAHYRDEQIVDLHMLIGLANLTNRFTGPLALELEFAPEKI
jgi:uncharacterized peroxidase-related enzyme